MPTFIGIESLAANALIDVSDTYGGTFRLKDTASLEDLRKYFRWTMTVRLFEAFMSPEALQKLGVRI